MGIIWREGNRKGEGGGGCVMVVGKMDVPHQKRINSGFQTKNVIQNYWRKAA